MPSLDAFPIFIADQQGFFIDEGLEVEIIRFTSGQERDIAFQSSDALDGLLIDLIALTMYHEGGLDVRAGTSTIGMAAIMGAEGVYTLEDIGNGNVLLLHNSAMDYILHRALEQAGLTSDAMQLDQVPSIPTRLELLLEGQATAATLNEPSATIADYNGFNTLATTRSIDVNPFAFAFRQSVIENKPEEVTAFFNAMNRAVAFLNTADRELFIDFLIESVGYPAEFRDILTVPYFNTLSAPNTAHVQSVLNFVNERGLITRELTVADITFDPFN